MQNQPITAADLAELKRTLEQSALQLRLRQQASYFYNKSEKLGEKYLNRWTSGVYSQNNEDAIISQIFNRIGTQDKFFLEIGIGVGIECNTRLLLEQGWQGVWIEGSKERYAEAKMHFQKFIESGALKIANEFLTCENINQVLLAMEIPTEIDFLSLDIDMNTSHIWRVMEIESRCACIEYNASYPPGIRFETKYDPNSVWARDNYFGASLETLNDIAIGKNLALVGCDVNGVNGFFVRETEVHDKFLQPFETEQHYEHAWYGVGRFHGHPHHVPKR